MLINYSNIIDPLLRSVRIKTLETSLIEKDSVVLDVCCGTGDQSFYYAQRSNHVFGIDIDPNMINLAGKSRKKDNNPIFIIADASNLPFKDNYFDLVSICLALHEKNEELRIKVLSEIKRVAKKDGTIIIVDYNVPLPNNPLSLFIKIIEFFAGKDHFECFNNYIKSGGIEEILKYNKLEAKENVFLIVGAIRLAKVILNN
ncbi:MAG: class I SAM-dependent methyltransferase [Candidatus Pacebacteria bacterium]|nr:class I SAM-dependent methyltransferase [Candidatus Paceibacterota bacterium]